MTVHELLVHLRSRDIKLRLDGEGLRFDAPTGAMTAEIRETLGSHRAQLVEYLRHNETLAETAPTAVTRVSRSGPLAVSFAQHRMWLLQQLAPGGAMYNMAGAIKLAGELDRNAITESLCEIQRRHEVLRTTFPLCNGEPVQQIGELSDLPVTFRDLSVEPAGDRRQRVRELTSEWVRKPFDLVNGPLFRVELVRIDSHEHVLLLALHHMVCDGWSIGVFVRELAAFYTAFAERRRHALPELQVQYADYAAWQREWLNGAVLEKQLAYWRRQLATAPAAIELPTDRPRPPVQTFDGALYKFVVGPEYADRLDALARQQGATLFMVLLAAFKVLLFRWTGQTDIVVGSPIANRVRPELEPLIGLFVNTLPLRTHLSDSASFDEVLDHVRGACLDAYEHQDIPIERLVEELRPDRDAGRSALFQVMFSLQTAPSSALELPGLSVEPLDIEGGTSRTDLTLSIRQTAGGLVGMIEYNTDLFDESTIERLAGSYRVLLGTLDVERQTPVGDLQLATDEDRARLLTTGSGQSSDPSRNATLAQLFQAAAARHADAVAIDDGDLHWRYDEVAHRANQVAHVLRLAGVRPNVTVGVWLARGAPLISTLVGVSLAGGAYVPLEPTQPVSRAKGMLEDASAAIVVTTAELAATVPAGPWRIVTLDEIAAAPGHAVSPLGTADDLAYVIYTSGSTGRPKGVAIPQRGVVRLVCDPDYVKLGPSTVMAQASTAAFDAATFEIWGALLNGGRLVIVPTDVAVAPAALGAYLQRTGITTLFLTTALVHQIGRERPNALGSVDTVLFGGETVEPRWVGAIQQAGGPNRLLHVYGPTETTTFATWFPVTADVRDTTTIPIGGPIVDTQTYVLDRSGTLTPVGMPGELCIGGDGLAHGYLGAARLTAERFVPDGVSGASGTRLYRTGDLVKWHVPGVLEFLGRRDNQVKLRGYRIELAEVEAALGSLADVGAAIVVVRGSGAERRLVGYTVAAPGAQLDADGLRDALKARLPAYMVPAAIVVLDALPLTTNGKIDRQALPEPAPDRRRACVAPRSEFEAAITAVWRTVLDSETIGVTDNFFDLGGHSLLLVRVQAGLEEALNRRVPLIALFQYPTIEALAGHLSGAERAGSGRTHAGERDATDGIAIIGMAGRFPGAATLEAFWANLRTGAEMIRTFTSQELRSAGVPEAVFADPQYVGARGALDGIDQFDAQLFGYTPLEAALLDPQQRLLLECAWEALERSGHPPRTRSSCRVGVYAGTSLNSYLAATGARALSGVGPVQLLIASDRDFLATRLSYKLQLTGPSLTVQTACSTSLVAVHTACQALRSGECDVALAGGVSLTVPSISGYMYQPEGITSPDGHCRPFDARAAGTVGGDGVGIVVLKPLARALADGDAIYAVIRGTAINNDGADKVGFTAPSVSGQAAVIEAALEAAHAAPESISYVEAHGTGTALGDPIELAALRQAFGDGAGPATCALGALKAAVGHLDAAAGVAGLIKTVLALSHRELPPNPYFTTPSPQLDFGPFYVPTQVRPWKTPVGIPRRAGVSSFGIGGTNAHVIVEEAPVRPPADPGRDWHIVPVSAQTPKAVSEAAERLGTALTMEPGEPLADVAYTQQTGRPALVARRVAVGRERAAIAAALRQEAGTVVSSGRRPLVWVFPGQGVPLSEMGLALYENEPVFRAELDACADALGDTLEGDLRGILYPSRGHEASAAAHLAETKWTQVALVAIELALAAQWRAWGITPDAVIGHSLGEISAACVAGVFSREAALKLAAWRGRLMQAAPPGGMLAVGASVDDLTTMLGGDLWLAAINGSHQCVLSGSAEALSLVEARLSEDGRMTQRLPGFRAFHSELMADVAEPLTEVAATLTRNVPQIAWISTVTGRVLSGAEATNPEYWGRQALAPVEWAAAAATVRATGPGAPVWLEVGPGRTLCNLLRDGAAAAEAIVPSLEGADAEGAVATALAQLWLHGVQPDWTAYHIGSRRHKVSLPTYPFQHERHWLARASATSLVAKRSDPAGWFYRPLWKQARPLSTERGIAGERRRWLIIADRSGLAEALENHLHDEDGGVIVVRTEDRGRQVPAYDEILQKLEAAGELPTDIVHLNSVTDDEVVGNGSVADGANRTFQHLLALGQALTRVSFANRVRLAVVTNHAYAVLGDEPINLAAATAAGPCRTIAAEIPNVVCRQIDLAFDEPSGPASVVKALEAELRSGAERGTIAIRGRHRWIQEFEQVRPEDVRRDDVRLREQGVYLITGGLGGVGFTLAELLAEQLHARLVLVGRTALPDRSAWDAYLGEHGEDETAERIRRVRRLEALGSEVLVAVADVASIQQMTDVLNQTTARFGSVNGVIHAAGVAGEGVIGLKRLEAAEAVLAPKVRGTIVLDRLFREAPLDFMVLCSSLTSFLGGPGQVDYCAANAFLDAYAQARWYEGNARVVSLNWDTWRDVGMAVRTAVPADLAARRQWALDAGITAAEGKDVFLRAMALGLPNVAICTKDLHAFMETVAAGSEADSGVPVPVTEPVAGLVKHPRPALATAFVAPARDTEAVVCNAFERALGVERIGINDNFFELGGHSLLAIDLMAHLNRHFGTHVPVAGLYEGLTPALLAALFDDRAQRGDDGREFAESTRRDVTRKRQVAAPRRRYSRSERRRQS